MAAAEEEEEEGDEFAPPTGDGAAAAAPRRPPPPSILTQPGLSLDDFEPTVEVDVASADFADFVKAVADFFELGHESASIKRLYDGIFMLMTLPATKKGMRDERWYLSYLKKLAEGSKIMVNDGLVYRC